MRQHIKWLAKGVHYTTVRSVYLLLTVPTVCTTSSIFFVVLIFSKFIKGNTAMTSILLSIMSFIAVLIIPREAAMQLTDNFYSDSPLPLTRGRCPIIETKDLNVIYYSHMSKYEICAKLEVEMSTASDPEISFYIIFGRSNHPGQHVCIYGNDQPVMMFSCTSESYSPSVDPKTESSIVTLYGRVIEPTFGYQTRCAMYINDDDIMHMMAISADKSCEGLQHMLHNPMSSFPPGYVLLYPSLPRHIERRSTSDNKNEIKNYSGSRFFWRTG